MCQWWVYIVLCRDSSLYTGITTDPVRRVEEHNHANTGARYTRARRPVRLVFAEKVSNRAVASQREHSIKRLPKPKKWLLLREQLENHGDLYQSLKIDTTDIVPSKQTQK